MFFNCDKPTRSKPLIKRIDCIRYFTNYFMKKLERYTNLKHDKNDIMYQIFNFICNFLFTLTLQSFDSCDNLCFLLTCSIF